MSRLPADIFRDLRPARRFSAAAFSHYDAAVTKNRRKAPVASLQSEDYALQPMERRLLTGSSRDIHRNFSIAGWMIRKHLDYVSTFTFQSRTGNRAVDNLIEAFVTWWSKPENFDALGRHSRERLTRLIEERRTVDGDVFLCKIADGRVQAIEGDRVCTPPGMPDGYNVQDFLHGVQLSPTGRVLRYCVCKRTRLNNFLFDRVVPVWNMEQHAFFDRIDQIRGISPMAAAINTLRDVYEGFDYALAKMKISQLFGLVFYREEDTALGPVTQPPADDGESAASAGYQVDLGRGPFTLDLEPNDRAEFLESKTPSAEFQQFSEMSIANALKSLDIPYSFFDESHTNYSGARQALLQYEQSAETKRADLRALLDRLTYWRLNLAITDGLISLPSGLTVDDLQWEWVSCGLPWIDPLKEINADILAINNGLRSRSEVLKEMGRDFTTTIDQLAAEQDYMKEKGVSVAAVPGLAPAPDEPAGDEGKKHD